VNDIQSVEKVKVVGEIESLSVEMASCHIVSAKEWNTLPWAWVIHNRISEMEYIQKEYRQSSGKELSSDIVDNQELFHVYIGEKKYWW